MKRIAVPIIPPRPTFRQKYDALVRQRAAEADTEHPDHGVELVDLVKDEMSRHVVPNRAMRRAAGERTGYSRRLRQRLAMAADMRRLDAIEDNPQRLAQYQERRSAAARRRERVAARVAARRVRLGL